MNSHIETQLNSLIVEFQNDADSTIGACLDAIRGFGLNITDLDRRQRDIVGQLQSPEPKDTLMASLDSAWFLYGEGDPNQPTAVVHHKTTQRDFKIRNSEGGTNHTFVGNIGLISIYQYWEESYRQRIADLFGKDKRAVECELFGDMRILRNSIIHHHGVAEDDVSNCKILRWFRPGETILIDQKKFLQLLSHLKQMTITLKTERT